MQSIFLEFQWFPFWLGLVLYKKVAISTGANNGLKATSGYIQLGGALTQPSVLQVILFHNNKSIEH